MFDRIGNLYRIKNNGLIGKGFRKKLKIVVDSII
jgi:hypothetical protein